MTGSTQSTQKTLRRTRWRQGHFAEYAAAAMLLFKGYRVLARRVRTPLGEIDLIAVRGGRLAFVEVKLRQSRAEAEAALNPRQRARIRRAAAFWIARNPRYQECEWGFDLVFARPWRWPQHLENAL